MQKAILSWSGGKDSALALHEVQQAGDYEIKALLTTITEAYDRSSMHGIRRTLIEQQADSLGIPLERVLLSPVSSNEEYDSRMREFRSATRQRVSQPSCSAISSSRTSGNTGKKGSPRSG